MAITLAAPLMIESDDVLVRLSRDNPGYRIEREEDGTITLSPAHTKGGAKSLKAGVQLDRYASIAGGIEVKSDTDDFARTVAHAKHFLSCGTSYAVAIDPETREVI